MSSRRKQLRNKAGAFAFRVAERSFLKRTAAEAERLGERLAGWAWRIDKKHRERTISNLAFAMPELDEKMRLETAHEVYRHFGRTAADFMRADVRTPTEVLDSIEVEGREHMEEAVAMQKGVLAITGHFGNWERFAHWMTLNGTPLTVVQRDADDTGIDAAMRRKRHAQGVVILSRGNTVRQILANLKLNHAIGILPDQNTKEAFVPFFGKPCGTVLGPAVLHLRTGAPLLPCYCPQVGPGRWKIVFRPVVKSPEGTRPEQIMTVLNAELEAMIRQYPSQWLWMHDRWKSARRAGLL